MKIKVGFKENNWKKMIEDLEAKLGTLGKGKEPLQLTQELSEDEEKDSGDKDEEEEEGNK